MNRDLGGGEGRARGERGLVETGGGDGSEMGSVMKKENKNRQPVSMPASPRNPGIKTRATTTKTGRNESTHVHI